MAKVTKKAPAKVKKHSSKYSKLAIVAGKELAAKKTALVRAEKALAKAQKTHQELLGEVARLDMLDRSLKALINGTEPPQNVRYVYTYPQWVWNPNYGYWYNNGTITIGQTQPTWQTTTSNFQGGQTCNLTTAGYNSINTTPATFGTLQTSDNCFTNTVNSGPSLSTSYSVNSGYADNSNSFTLDSAPVSGSILTTTGATPQWQSTNLTLGQADFTVDLSTGATETDEITMEEVLAQSKLEVGNGG